MPKQDNRPRDILVAKFWTIIESALTARERCFKIGASGYATLAIDTHANTGDIHPASKSSVVQRSLESHWASTRTRRTPIVKRLRLGHYPTLFNTWWLQQAWTKPYNCCIIRSGTTETAAS